MCHKETLLMQKRFTMCGMETLFNSLGMTGAFLRELAMIERGLYYSTEEFKKLIRSVGGEWADTKNVQLFV